MRTPENGNAPAGTEADPEHTAEQLHANATCADARFQVAYSRGYGEQDNMPAQHVAESFAAFRDAILAGLGARLVGDGTLEDDEGETLLSEIEALIEQFGADTLAEDFLRYE